jgi:hypothetical protein
LAVAEGDAIEGVGGVLPASIVTDALLVCPCPSLTVTVAVNRPAIVYV